MNRMQRTLNKRHTKCIDSAEVEMRIRGILKAAGVEASIAGGYISATFPDGAVAYCQPLQLDTDDE